MNLTDTQVDISNECTAINDLLVAKNRKYGNSALEPSNLFAQASALEQIAIRIDDKIKRIANMGGLAAVLTSQAEDGEDTVQDLIGYLILARVCAKKENTCSDSAASSLTGAPTTLCAGTALESSTTSPVL